MGGLPVKAGTLRQWDEVPGPGEDFAGADGRSSGASPRWSTTAPTGEVIRMTVLAMTRRDVRLTRSAVPGTRRLSRPLSPHWSAPAPPAIDKRSTIVGVAIGPDGALATSATWTTSGSAASIWRRVERATSPAAASAAMAATAAPRRRGSLNMPHEIAFDRAGHLFIAERDSHVVRKVDAGTGRLSTVAGPRHARLLGRRRPRRPGPPCASPQRGDCADGLAADLRRRQPSPARRRSHHRDHPDNRGEPANAGRLRTARR